MNFDQIDDARKLLGLGEEATLKEIKDAYHSLAHHHHPDKPENSAAEDEQMMKKLNQAYKVLMDYCNTYRYSFKIEEVVRTYPYEEEMRRWNESWYDLF